MKNKTLSLLFVLFVYIAAFGAGWAALRLPAVSFLNMPLSWHPLLAVLLANIIATVIVFIFNLIVKNASLYDPYWSVQPVFNIAAMYLYFGLSFRLPQLFVMIPLALWSVRLTANWAIGFDNLHWEDWRYRMYKAKFPRISQLIIFTGIMMMPTILVFFGTVPVWYFLQKENYNLFFPALGGFIILLGTIFEFFADNQMRRYRRRPNRGYFIDEGLWRYSRHPNYFGEILVWIGIFIAALVNHQPINFAGFILITLLFIFISIPMMERHILEKKPEYIIYRKRVWPLMFGPRG